MKTAALTMSWRRLDVRRRMGGFTLVELLVIIAIIGVLVSLLMPAVQRSIESARRATCQANLGNIAKAAALYEDTYGVFPSSLVDSNPAPNYGTQTPNDNVPGLAWSFYILPFLEEQSRYDEGMALTGTGTLNWQLQSGSTGWVTSDFALSPKIAQRPLAVYECPTNRGYLVPQNGAFENVAGMTQGNLAKCNYAANSGDNTAVSGVMFLNSKVKLSQIVDGTSNTLLVGERSSTPQTAGPGGAAGSGPCGGVKCDFRGGYWIGAPNEYYSSGSYPGMLTFRVQCQGDDNFFPFNRTPTNTYTQFIFSSPHEGGMFAARCDGSVTWIPNSMSLTIWKTLTSRADGSALGAW